MAVFLYRDDYCTHLCSVQPFHRDSWDSDIFSTNNIFMFHKLYLITTTGGLLHFENVVANFVLKKVLMLTYSLSK